MEILSGPYTGLTVNLHPKSRAPCFIGRSTGKKFRDRGISLPSDQELSTTHGKFESKRGKIYFTDMGSTNGTFVNGEQLSPGKDLKLDDGTVIDVGLSRLEISLIYR